MKTTPALRSCLRSLLAIGITMALCSTPALARQAPEQTAQATTRDFDIPAQPLDSALTRLADQAGVRILFASDEVASLQPQGVTGRYTTEQALTQLLSGTGMAWHWREPGIVAIERAAADRQAANGVVTTGTLNVSGERVAGAAGEQRDIQGHDDVYDLDLSTSYIGRKEIERYKGTTPSDLVKGVPGVFSGDARNSGALDISIRGIQGPGRVPVVIDGTEQALTVWRGYNGATNRNYIDPFLIGGIQVIKGPAQVRNVNTGIGGAMVVNTLDVDDFLKPGEKFGGEIKVEGSSNSVDPRVPTLLTGEDYRDVPGFGSSPNIPYLDPSLRITPKTGGGGYNVFKGEDYAYRAALGYRPTDNLDFLFAYAYRERGNYYSGKHDASYYQHDRTNYSDDYINSLANYFSPGSEVPNTSSQMESYLFKASWRPADDQALQFGYRKSLSHYGEIMPSRILVSNITDQGDIQWPLSRVDTQAYNLEYKWRPEDSRWMDFYANLWRTDTVSDTYTAGGFPNYADPAWELDYPNQYPDASTLLHNTALANATDIRNGVTLSNKFHLADSLDFTVGGNFQHEKLSSADPYFGTSDGWRMYPRAGRREEWNADFSFEWRPLDFLTLNAGARYSSYWAFDDFLAVHQDDFGDLSVVTSYQVTYAESVMPTQQEIDAGTQALRDAYQPFIDDALASGQIDTAKAAEDEFAQLVAQLSQPYTKATTVPWEPDSNGHYSKATNVCLNGALSDHDLVGCSTSSVRTDMANPARKRKDHGWVPFFTATVNFSDYSRAYVRYGEMLRYPSMFESTIGFSSSLNPWDLKPEHSYNWEVAYVHDLSHLLSPGSIADVKLAWYRNKTADVIERDSHFYFYNIDKQVISGLDLQGRYDNGRFFTDLAFNYQIKDQVCDQSTAAINTALYYRMDGSSYDFPNCVKYGYVGGYLLTQATPELSTTWSLGGRFFDKRLEVGGRVVHYKQYSNPDLEAVRDHSITSGGTFPWGFNIPLSWGQTTVIDAYASYKLHENLSAELTVTNLTDQFYVDPATRSAMAAPGRTLKLSLTGRF